MHESWGQGHNQSTHRKRNEGKLTVMVSMVKPISWMGLRPHESMNKKETQSFGTVEQRHVS